jgi:2-keto-4-pentenoate hydratase
MTVNFESIQKAADALYEARRDKRQIARISDTFDIHTENDAYSVARISSLASSSLTMASCSIRWNCWTARPSI